MPGQPYAPGMGMPADQARYRRTVEIAYVLVSSAALLVVVAVAYEVVRARLGPVPVPVVRAGCALVAVLLVARAVRLLRRLEAGLRSSPDRA